MHCNAASANFFFFWLSPVQHCGNLFKNQYYSLIKFTLKTIVVHYKYTLLRLTSDCMEIYLFITK